MLDVVILLVDGAWGSQVMGVLDFVAIFKRMAARYNKTYDINVQLSGLESGNIVLGNGLTMQVELLANASNAKTITIVPGVEFTQLQQTLKNPAVDWKKLRTFLEAQTAVLGLSTGSFLLAETGLLHNLPAVTHWSFGAYFTQRYPNVPLKKDGEFANNGHICTTTHLAGAIYWLAKQLQSCENQAILDKCLALTLKQTESSTDFWLMDTFDYKRHTDTEILRLQNFIDAHYAEKFSLATLCDRFGGSETNLKRRFKLATGIPVSSYYQLVRMLRMKHLLLDTDDPVDKISTDIGYFDSRFARRLFTRTTGLSPIAFRKQSSE